MSARPTRRRFLHLAAIAGVALPSSSSQAEEPAAKRQPSHAKSSATPAKGPLQVHPKNPRYFTGGTGRAVYLTASHTWGNLCEYPPKVKHPPLDYAAYLDFLGRYHHNFIRLWAGDGVGYRPSVYVRTGPGKATDGEPRVDLTRLNRKYFDRLRERVVAARDRGIYVGIMLFRPDNMHAEHDWPGHLFNPANNVQGLSGDTNGDRSGAEAYDLSVPRITRIQEEYVRKIVDTVNDLDNVLYEIGNEGPKSSVKWQYHFIRFIKKYEAGKPKQHPVGMTGGGFDNEELFKSPADWISPAFGYDDSPPGSDGSKVIIVDTDHQNFLRGDPWKCFLRGLHFIHMDTYTRVEKPQRGFMSADEQEAVRRAMGQTRRLAERLDLAAMKPHDDLASTKYCLAQPGVAYVVYLPKGGEATVELSAAKGSLEVEWIDPVMGKVEKAPAAQGGAGRTFRSPFAGGAVLYLRRK